MFITNFTRQRSNAGVSRSGQVSTYQLGGQQPWGVSYKISPETNEVDLNVMKCFQVNGTEEEAVTPQATLPQLQGFEVCLSEC